MHPKRKKEFQRLEGAQDTPPAELCAGILQTLRLFWAGQLGLGRGIPRRRLRGQGASPGEDRRDSTLRHRDCVKLPKSGQHWAQRTNLRLPPKPILSSGFLKTLTGKHISGRRETTIPQPTQHAALGKGFREQPAREPQRQPAGRKDRPGREHHPAFLRAQHLHLQRHSEMPLRPFSLPSLPSPKERKRKRKEEASTLPPVHPGSSEPQHI